jgi:hypothetical protein
VVNTLLSAFTMGMTEQTEVSGDDKLLLDMGLATVMVCATLLAAFVATSVLSREIENKTALTVISKPVGRPVFVIGKYAGVSGAILIATVIMTVFFLLAIRHKVMSTARDEPDGPVLLFGTLAMLIPIGLAIWGNYFYGWVFSSTAVGWMLPASVLAYLIVLTIGKDWSFQPITKDIKPQILIAAACASIAILVLTAVAVAASTRLGQVMTIVVCAGVFVLGLLSNHLLGRHAFSNDQIAVVGQAEPVRRESGVMADLSRTGDEYKVTLKGPPKISLKPGMSIYYGAEPGGMSLAVPAHPPFTGDLKNPKDVLAAEASPSVVIKELSATVGAAGGDNSFTLVNLGGLAVSRPPQAGDYLFSHPTVTNWPARVAWSVVPNLQFFWMVDAITQGHPIPLRYLGLVAGYGALQAGGLLALAVALFQRRDVG